MTSAGGSVPSVRAKVSTGYARLDEALQGGFLVGSMIVLSSPASDEVPLLLRNFLDSADGASLLVCRTLSSAENLAKAGKVNVLVCSDKPATPAKNIVPGKGIENLTELNLTITDAIGSLKPKRLALYILSDILLRHKALQTRKWLTELLERLRSKEITTLALLNPHMHAAEETQAVTDLFDGNLEMVEKETDDGLRKFLLVKWMHGVEVAEKELPLTGLAHEVQTQAELVARYRMEPPEVRYAKSGEVHVAYQVLGRGPVDVVHAPGHFSHLDVQWDWPVFAQFLRELASFTRLILFDKRGTGMSDRDVGVATLEDRMDDIRAVMDAVGSRRAILFGDSEGVAMSILFAATYPERTLGLILWGGVARVLRAPNHPWGPTREEFEASLRQDEVDWGTEAYINRTVAYWASSRMNDAPYKRWFRRLIRHGLSPSADIALWKMFMEIDVRSVLPVIHVPTLVLHATEDRAVRVERGRYIASQIHGAKFVEISSPDHDFGATPTAADAVLSSIRQFVGQLQPSLETDRILTTVLFTDIVGSTKRASAHGDREWGRLRGEYFEKARTLLARFRGREIKTAGDGMLAIFDGPTRAIRCACALRDQARDLGLEIRAGLHTGECVLREGDVQGIAVRIAARVSEQAREGEVLVSGTVRDLSVGSDVRFGDRGMQAFKGLDGEWRTYVVENS